MRPSHFPVWFSIQEADGDVGDDVLVSIGVLYSPPLDGPLSGPVGVQAAAHSRYTDFLTPSEELYHLIL